MKQNLELNMEISKLKQKLNMKTGTAGTLKYLEKLIRETVDDNEVKNYCDSYNQLLNTFNNIK
jgi:hypothetical protein